MVVPYLRRVSGRVSGPGERREGGEGGGDALLGVALAEESVVDAGEEEELHEEGRAAVSS